MELFERRTYGLNSSHNILLCISSYLGDLCLSVQSCLVLCCVSISRCFMSYGIPFVPSVHSTIPSLPSLVQHMLLYCSCIADDYFGVFFCLNLLSFIRQLLVPGYQEIWYTADGARKSSSPANNVRLWKWDVLTLLDDPAPPASIHSCALIVFPLPATVFLPWGGLGRGWFKCCCEHVLRTQVQKRIFGCWKLISIIKVV